MFLTFISRSSFIAGLAGAIASNPVDVVKTRLMNQQNLRDHVLREKGITQHIYKNSLDCLIKVRISKVFFPPPPLSLFSLQIFYGNGIGVVSGKGWGKAAQV